MTEETVWDVRNSIGMVFQNPDNQFVGTTVQDDVAFGLENHGVPRDEMVKRVHDSLKKVKMDGFQPRASSFIRRSKTKGCHCRGSGAGAIDNYTDEATSMLIPRSE